MFLLVEFAFGVEYMVLEKNLIWIILYWIILETLAEGAVKKNPQLMMEKSDNVCLDT